VHSYLVVAAKPGRVIPPHVLDLLDDAFPTDLAFIPSAHVRWTDTAGRLAFGGWQGFTDVAGIGSHWWADARGLTSFSGRLWPHGSMWTPGRPWAQQLSEHWRAHAVDKVGQPFDGIFTALALNADGTGEMITDPLALASLYRAETDDMVVYANRAALAARAATPPDRQPERDPLGCGWMVYTGYLMGDRTGFTAVRVLPLGAFVELHPRFGSRVRPGNPTPWVHPDGLPDDPATLVGLVHDDLARRVESATRLPAPVRPLVEITGGRDSRLILALLVEGGLAGRLKFTTSGAEGAPDQVVAGELAVQFGLKHRPLIPRGFQDPQFLRRLQIHSFQTSGALNAWDLKGGTGVANRFTVSGLFGEILRTAFAKHPEVETAERLLTQFLTRTHVDTLGVLRPEVRAQYQRVIEAELIERVDAESGLPLDRLDSFYVRNRLRRQPAFTEEVGNDARVYPLYSLLGFQAGFVLGPARRRNEYLMFQVMRAACPPLVEARFADRGWHDALLAGEPDPDRYRAAPCTGAGPASPSPTPQPWQQDRFERHREVIDTYLLTDPQNPLFEVVDRAALEGVLAGHLPPGMHARFQGYGALAAAVWLGGHEAAVRVGVGQDDLPDPLPLPVPPPPPPPSPSAARRLAAHLPPPIRRPLATTARRLRRR
jgi:hypothetical protein